MALIATTMSLSLVTIRSVAEVWRADVAHLGMSMHERRGCSYTHLHSGEALLPLVSNVGDSM